MIPSQKENPEGLHRRYIISKANGEPVDQNAEYFVLRLDSEGDDQKHINACRNAVLKYAEEIRDHLPELSKELSNKYEDLVETPEDKMEVPRYYLNQNQIEMIEHYKRMFETNAGYVQQLCDSEKSDIVYGFELGKMHYHLRECFVGMMELEDEIRAQKIKKR